MRHEPFVSDHQFRVHQLRLRLRPYQFCVCPLVGKPALLRTWFEAVLRELPPKDLFWRRVRNYLPVVRKRVQVMPTISQPRAQAARSQHHQKQEPRARKLPATSRGVRGTPPPQTELCSAQGCQGRLTNSCRSHFVHRQGGHNLQEHSVIRCVAVSVKNLPGVRYHIIVRFPRPARRQDRKQARSKYGQAPKEGLITSPAGYPNVAEARHWEVRPRPPALGWARHGKGHPNGHGRVVKLQFRKEPELREATAPSSRSTHESARFCLLIQGSVASGSPSS